jgi:hypothetical protein
MKPLEKTASSYNLQKKGKRLHHMAQRFPKNIFYP